jgi:malic enzyme
VLQLQPSVLIGAAAQPGAFTPAILNLMAQNHQRRFIFSLFQPHMLSTLPQTLSHLPTSRTCALQNAVQAIYA